MIKKMILKISMKIVSINIKESKVNKNIIITKITRDKEFAFNSKNMEIVIMEIIVDLVIKLAEKVNNNTKENKNTKIKIIKDQNNKRKNIMIRIKFMNQFTKRNLTNVIRIKALALKAIPLTITNIKIQINLIIKTRVITKRKAKSKDNIIMIKIIIINNMIKRIKIINLISNIINQEKTLIKSKKNMVMNIMLRNIILNKIKKIVNSREIVRRIPITIKSKRKESQKN